MAAGGAARGVLLVAWVLGMVGDWGLAAQTVVQAPPPMVRLDPDEVEPGGVVQVSGADWHGQCRVDLVFDDVPLSPAVPENGTFTVDVAVPSDTAPGPHRVVATGREFSRDDVGDPCAGASNSRAETVLQVLAAPAPVLEFSATSIDFGAVAVGAQAVERLTATNAGTGELTITAVELSDGDTGAFAVIDDGCSQRTLPAGGACALTVVFEPTDDGQVGAELAVTSDDVASPHLVTVAGRTPAEGDSVPIVDRDNWQWLLWAVIGLLTLIVARLLRPRSPRWVRAHVAARPHPHRAVESAVDALDGGRSHAVRIVARPGTGTQTIHEVIP